MSDDLNARKRQARFAGALYLLFGVTSAIGMNIPSAFMTGDAAATVARIEASQLTYRFYLVRMFQAAVRQHRWVSSPADTSYPSPTFAPTGFTEMEYVNCCPSCGRESRSRSQADRSW